MRVHVLAMSLVGLFVYTLGCSPQNTNSLSTSPKYCTNSNNAYVSLPSGDKPSDVCNCDDGYYAGVIPNMMIGGYRLVECLSCPEACPSSCSRKTGECP